MDKDVTKKNEGDYATIALIGATILLALPIVFGMLFARGLISIFHNIKHKKFGSKASIYFVSIFLIIYSATTIGLAFALGTPSEAKTISWYDYLFPIATEIKVIIGFVNTDTTSTTDVLLMLVTPLSLSFLLAPIFLVFRPFAKSGYTTSIAYYEKKLHSEEVVDDPRKNISLFQQFYFFLLVIDRRALEKKTLTKEEMASKAKTHIMLDGTYGIPRKYLNRHLAILGTTGSGKTETTFNFLKDSISHQKPTIFVDGKGDIKNVFRMKELADKYGRHFQVFTLSGRDLVLPHLKNRGTNKTKDYDDFVKSFAIDERNEIMEKLENGEEVNGWTREDVTITPSKYNPFDTDNEGILVDTIMSLFNYSEEHYKAGARVYMDLLVKTLIENKTPVSWENIMFYLDKWKLIEGLKQRYHIEASNGSVKNNEAKASNGGKIVLTKSINKQDEGTGDIQGRAEDVKSYNIDLNQIQNIDDRAITGFTSRIGMYYNTTRNTITKDGFTLGDVLAKNGVAVFSLNSLDYQEQASAIGRLIVNNIKASAELNSRLKKQTTIALDEFNVFADNNVIDILNKTRSKGYEIILAFQSIADLTKISEDFKNQVIENTNNKIIHNTNDPIGAEYIAKVLGTYKKQNKTYQAETSELKGGESIRVVESFIAHPNDIKTLKTGEAFAKYTKEDGSLFTTPHKIKIKLNNR